VSTLVLDGDYLTNFTSPTAKGTVLVETAAELQLINASTVDAGKITTHGEIESFAGINTIAGVTGSDFINDGVIAVEATVGGVNTDSDGDITTPGNAAAVRTLVV